MNNGEKVRLSNLFRSEWQRMFKRKRTWAVLIAYALFTVLECVFLASMRTSFYDQQHSVVLDSLNTAPFLLRELAVLVNFVIIPMLAADSFGGDVSSGALRFALIRPVSRAKLFGIKGLVLGFTLGGLTLFTWISGTVFARIAMPHVEQTHVLGIGEVGSLGALGFTLAFYGLAFLVFLALIGIGGVVSIILPNPVLAYIGILAVVVGGIYVSDRLAFLLSVSDSIFRFLGGIAGADASLGWLLCVLLAGCAIIGAWSWQRREWMQ